MQNKIDSLNKAMEAVRSGKMSKAEAAKTFEVPRTTLLELL